MLRVTCNSQFLMAIAIVSLFGLALKWGFGSGSGETRNNVSSLSQEFGDLHDMEAVQQSDLHYAIIVDAGSSGSRLFVYIWPSTAAESNDLLKIRPLLNAANQPVVMKVSPGISSFAQSPENATDYIVPLLELAAAEIPKAKHKETILFIFATAGLRLVKESESTAILNNLREELPKKFEFIISPKNIDMISGKWEGIYSWIAVNYALGRFEHATEEDPGQLIRVTDVANNRTFSRRPTVGMIDMGGGSLQIAYEVQSPVPRDQEHLVADFNLGCDDHDLEHKYRLYVTTFLGMGANIAQTRYESLLLQMQNSLAVREPIADKDKSADSNNARELSSTSARSAEVATKSTLDANVASVDIVSADIDDAAAAAAAVKIRDPCIQPGRRRTIYAQNNPSEKKVVFLAQGSGDFVECKSLLKSLLNLTSLCQWPPCSMAGMHQPPIDFVKAEFYGFSEFWYTSNDVHGLSGLYDYEMFVKESSAFCSTKWSTVWSRFRKKLYPKADKDRIKNECFKSAWLSAALHDGFNFPKAYDHLKIVSTINNQEVQWTLGALLYQMRFFTLRERQNAELKRQRLAAVPLSGGSYFSSVFPSGSGALSQVLLLACFVVVVLAAIRYFLVLRRFRRRYFSGSDNMHRNTSMTNYMMTDSNGDAKFSGIRTEWSGYVY